MSSTADNIMNSAIGMIRQGGYHSFSFRQIADELGLKSSTIHYHFPSKERLGIAVAEKYTNDFMGILGHPADRNQPLAFYIETFQRALETTQTSCLCGILAAEAKRLPETVAMALADFTTRNLDWLQTALKQEHPDWDESKVREMASLAFSSLEGAITFAALQNDPAYLEQVGDGLRTLLS